MAPVQWQSNKQATVESSVYGAEFVAMKVGIEVVRRLRYKLWMMGVPISGPTYIYGDNMSVIHNTQRPESVLKKKSNLLESRLRWENHLQHTFWLAEVAVLVEIPLKSAGGNADKIKLEFLW
eukprot:scaffold36889_cov64-Attheya_sp.AAC.3